MKPTADQLADSIQDAALGGEMIPGLQRDEYLLSFAKLIRARMRKDDQRLAILEPHTDRNGYVWLPTGSLDWRDEAHRHSWSYERRLTAFLDAAAKLPGPGDEELDRMADLNEGQDRLMKEGWKLGQANYDPETGAGGWIFTRDPGEGAER